jgi:hypothetical protein
MTTQTQLSSFVSSSVGLGTLFTSSSQIPYEASFCQLQNQLHRCSQNDQAPRAYPQLMTLKLPELNVGMGMIRDNRSKRKLCSEQDHADRTRDYEHVRYGN